jgi:hypothetical protein
MMDRGTLVVMIPTQDGLVAASDSRLTLDDTSCDGVEKFIELKTPDRTLMVVTGRRGFWPLPFYFMPDKCTAARTMMREFDLGEVAKSFVESANVPIEALDTAALREHCLSAMNTYLASSPQWINGTTASSSVVLASFDPITHTSRIRSIEFSFSFSPGGASTAQDKVNAIYSPRDLAEPFLFGESPYYLKHVHPVLTASSKRQETRAFFGSIPLVQKMKLEDAIEIATEMIEAASQMTAVVPAESGIGGPIDVRVLTTDSRPFRRPAGR